MKVIGGSLASMNETLRGNKQGGKEEGMRESIALHVGQAGARVGTAIWELLSIEHGKKSLI